MFPSPSHKVFFLPGLDPGSLQTTMAIFVPDRLPAARLRSGFLQAIDLKELDPSRILAVGRQTTSEAARDSTAAVEIAVKMAV
jgi:hypothetical protein